MPSSTNHKTVAVLTTGLLLAGTGVAFAYWTGTGAGTGEAQTGQATTAVVVNQTTVVTDLRPGGAAQLLEGNFDNPNDTPVHVESVTVAIDDVVEAAEATGECTADDYRIDGAVMQVGRDISPGTAQGTWRGALISFNNKPDVNQDACQGATVSLGYTLS